MSEKLKNIFFSFVLIDLENLPVAIKKSCECPNIPIVPGPVISLRTFTMANVPLINPKPYPEARKIKILLYYKKN